MKYNLLLLSILLAAACNNSGDSKDKKDDTVAVQHDTMHHAPATGTVPELPAVPEGSKVFFKNLKNNATVTSPFTVEMGTEVMRVDTANLVVAGSGHHHLFINAEDSLATGETVPKDSAHVHFGKGQTAYELSLAPGKYKLTLQLADGLHRSYGSKLSAVVNITVKK